MESETALDHFTLTVSRLGDGWLWNVCAWDEDDGISHIEGGQLVGTLVPTGGKSLPTATRIILLTLADS